MRVVPLATRHEEKRGAEFVGRQTPGARSDLLFTAQGARHRIAAPR